MAPSPPPRTRDPSMPADPAVLRAHVELHRRLVIYPLIDRLHRLHDGLLAPRLRPDGLVPMTPSSAASSSSSSPSRATPPSSARASAPSTAPTSATVSAVKPHKRHESPRHAMVCRSRRRADTRFFELDASGKVARLCAAPRRLRAPAQRSIQPR